MNSVVKTMDKQTTTVKHAKETTATLGSFGSLIWENQSTVISVTTGLQNMTSSVFNWDFTLHQSCARTYSPTGNYFLTSLVAPYSSSLPQNKGISLPPVLSEPLLGGSQFLMTISLDWIYAMIKKNRWKKNSWHLKPTNINEKFVFFPEYCIKPWRLAITPTDCF